MGIKDDLLSIMSQWAPEDASEPWDNVGLQIDTNRQIERIALVLELNLDTWDVVQKYDYDFIVSHHPLIFKPIKHIGYDDWSHRLIRSLIIKDIGFYVSHTNLDRANDGVTDALMHQFDFNILNVTDICDGFGKMVSLVDPLQLIDIEDKVSVLAKVIPDDLSIHTIALCGGSGKSLIHQVVQQGADLFITGELGYHDIQYLRQQNVGVLLLGHYQSEVFILDEMHQRLNHLNASFDIIK